MKRIYKEVLIALAILVVGTCFFIGFTRSLDTHVETRKLEWQQEGKTRVQAILEGADLATITITCRGTYEPPSNIRIIRVVRSGKYTYNVTLEGPKQDIAKILANYYGLPE